MTNKTIVGIIMAFAWTLLILALYTRMPLMSIWGAVAAVMSTSLYYKQKS